jgi:site-specific DNA recombinase
MPSTNGHGSEPERVALYLRVSSEEQRDAGTIETQREFLDSYCNVHDLEVVATYADDGISGTIPLHERPAGKELLADAKEGKFGSVLVYRLDRLGRSIMVVLDAHDRLEASETALVSATEHIDTTTPSGRLHFQMLGSFAEFERASIRERTRDGLHRAMRNGKQPGVIPFAFTIDEKAGTLVVVPEEAEIVRKVFENVAAGATLYSEAKRLNDEGIPSPGWRYRNGEAPKRAGRWGAPTLRNLIHRRAYSGTHEARINGGKDIITRAVPAIVTPELQAAALAQLADNKRFSGGKKRRSYLLAGLVTCRECGCSCTGLTHLTRGKAYPYYKCSDDRASRSHRGPMHNAPHVPAEWLEDTVWSDVRRFLENPGEVLERAKEGLSESGDAESLEARRGDLAKRLAAKHKERERWLHLYAEGHIEGAELETYLTDLRGQTDNLRLLLESVEGDLSRKREEVQIAATTEAWLMTLRERIEEVEGDSEEAFKKRRELVRLLVERITVGRSEDGHIKVQMTYRFGPPSEATPDSVVSGNYDSGRSSALNG